MGVWGAILFAGTIVATIAIVWAILGEAVTSAVLENARDRPRKRPRKERASQKAWADGVPQSPGIESAHWRAGKRLRSLLRAQMLARNAKGSPIADVRVASLQALQSDFPYWGLTREVSRAALHDKAPAVRLVAAEFLDEEGTKSLHSLLANDPMIDVKIQLQALRLICERSQPSAEGVVRTLRDLANGGPAVAPGVCLKAVLLLVERAQALGEQELRSLRDAMSGDLTIPAEVLAEGLRVLVGHAPREMVVPVLDWILDHVPLQERSWLVIEELPRAAPSQMWLEAATACGALQHTGATARLVAALGSLDLPSAEVVTEALVAIGDPATEPALIELLDTDDPGTAVAAARALRWLGTAAAVEPLRARIDGVLTSATLKRAGREAIEAIQGRLTGAESGQLGLAEAPAAQGLLSVSDPSQDGRVSLPDPLRPEGESERE